MAVATELAVGGESLERLALEHAVWPDVVERPGLEAEEASVYPRLEPGLLLEADDPAVTVEIGNPELEPRADHGDRRERPLRTMKLEQRTQVDIGDSVGVGGAARLAPKQL